MTMISSRNARSVMLGLAVLPLLGACKTAHDPVSVGHELAVQWCSECHRVEPAQPSGARPGHVLPSPMHGPSFMEIAARPSTDAPWLRRFADALHLPMPIYRLPPVQQDAVIAYILSLKSVPDSANP